MYPFRDRIVQFSSSPQQFLTPDGAHLLWDDLRELDLLPVGWSSAFVELQSLPNICANREQKSLIPQMVL